MSLDIAADKVENDIDPKADRHIFKRARNKAARLLHHSLGGVGVAKITADYKKHRHRQAVKRKMRIALPRQVYRYYHKAQKELKKVKVNVSLALFRLHGFVLACGWFVLGGVDPVLHIISHLRRVCKGWRASFSKVEQLYYNHARGVYIIRS